MSNPGRGRTTRIRGAGGRFASTGGAFTTGNSFHFEAGSTLERGMAQFTMKMEDAIDEVFDEFISELENYARTNAPWDNRTGAARSGLTASWEATDRVGVISLYHTVDYGIWLEIRWGGRYAIIMPTMERFGPRLLEKMRGIMDRTIFYA